MMKRLLGLLLFVSAFLNAQHTITGTMTPPEEGDWAALYKLGGAKQKFIAHTSVEKSSVEMAGGKQAIGTFHFNLPKGAKRGVYRITYRDRGAGFVDFFFNNEDVEMIFNPEYPEQSIVYTKSLENKIYLEYLDAQALSQTKLDSLQEVYLKNKDKGSKKAYKKEVSRLEDSQEFYEKKSKGMLVNKFIKSSKVDNPSTPVETLDEYRNNTVNNYFNNVDFNSVILQNSAFLISKASDYIFYLNTADTQVLQQKMYKESIKKVMNKVTSNNVKKSLLEFLISTFTGRRNSEIVDWMITDYYDKLPLSHKNDKFKQNKLEALKVSVGRTAPDFSWKEDGKSMKLSTLNDGEKYLLIFWSTQCSHCVKEIPDVYKFMEDKEKVSTVAFAIEEDDLGFNSWTKNKLYKWHNAIGTNPGGNKFENKTVRDYLIDATPTYFVLDKNKKIIAVPNEAKDVKDYFKK